MDDAIALEGARAQHVCVVQVAAQDLRAPVGDGLGRGVRACQPDNLVTGTDELGDDGRADPAGSAGDEDAHRRLLGCLPVKRMCGVTAAAGT